MAHPACRSGWLRPRVLLLAPAALDTPPQVDVVTLARPGLTALRCSPLARDGRLGCGRVGKGQAVRQILWPGGWGQYGHQGHSALRGITH